VTRSSGSRNDASQSRSGRCPSSISSTAPGVGPILNVSGSKRRRAAAAGRRSPSGAKRLSSSSADAGERFGEYLVGRDILTRHDLGLALRMLPHYNGKLGDTLVALGMLRPLDVFRLLSEQVRDRVIDVFAWTEGTFSFYRGVVNRQESFPLGLDTFEMLGAGVVSLPPGLLENRFATLGELRPTAAARRRFDPEAFKIGPTPGAVLDMLDGSRALRGWLASFTDPDERVTFLRTLYLLVETDLAQLD
jgi:hypothetical protein